MDIADTARLRIRTVTLEEPDLAFVLELLNDPAFIANIADRGVRTIEQCRSYLEKGTLAMQEQHGHSMYVVELKDCGTRIGLCGLVKRDTLPDVDIGYAFLPQYRGNGYAWEAAEAVVGHAKALGIRRLAGITNPANEASNRLLEKLGLRFVRLVHLDEHDPGTNLYLRELG